MVKFIIGLISGAILGIFIIALLGANREKTKEMSAKEFIKIIDDVFDDKFGEGGLSYLTLPSGKRVSCDTGYVCEFWDDFISDMKELRPDIFEE